MRPFLLTSRFLLALAVTLPGLPVAAAPLIELSAEASRAAANDLVRASVYSEATAANPAEVARKVNQEIAEALKLIKGREGVTVKSGRQSTYPVYSPGQKIDGWRMRSELIVESRDLPVLSELIGKLQQMRLALGQVSQMPSPETRRAVEDEATRDAIRAFESRAAVIAAQLGKPWQIKQLNVQQSGNVQPVLSLRATRAGIAESPPAPLEAGESLLTTTVSGQIELQD